MVRKQQAPEWVTAIFLFVLLMIIFPVAAQMIFGAILLGMIFGVIISIIILVLWWYLERNRSPLFLF